MRSSASWLASTHDPRLWSKSSTAPLCKDDIEALVISMLKDSNSEKEREQSELEVQSSNANKNLQAAQTSLSSLKTQLKAKQDEIKSKLFEFCVYNLYR